MKAPNPNALNTLTKAPVTDPIIAGNTTPTSTDGNTATAVSAGNAVNAGTAAHASTASGGQTKLTIRLDGELHGAIRAAYLADLAAGSELTSLSQWAAYHLARGVHETERRLNGGQPFAPLGAGIIPIRPS